MVRRSFLVYDLLRTEQRQDGFSEKEIVEQISDKHAIVPGKGLRRQIAVALRRGLDFGILAKKNNKFRFDLDRAKLTTSKREAPKKKVQAKRKPAKKPTKGKQQRSVTRKKSRKENEKPVPRPRLPKPPNWEPRKRNLAEEPVTKVKKHS